MSKAYVAANLRRMAGRETAWSFFVFRCNKFSKKSFCNNRSGSLVLHSTEAIKICILHPSVTNLEIIYPEDTLNNKLYII